MKRLALLVIFLALAGCNEGTAETTASVGADAGYKVDKLFTNEGCTVYRFRDGGYSRYYTNCSGSTLTMHTNSCGKSCTEHWDGSVSGGGR